MKTLHVLALDPGPTWMGWCQLRVEHDPGVRCHFVKGGFCASTRENFQAVVSDTVWERALHMDAESESAGICIERPRGFAFQPGRVPQLLDTAFIAGGMSWVAATRGFRVVECTAQQVRKVLAGKANADDDVVKQTVERLVFGAAGASNEHVRDALAVGVLGAWVMVGQTVLPEVSDGSKARKKSGESGKGRPRRRVDGSGAKDRS